MNLWGDGGVIPTLIGVTLLCGVSAGVLVLAGVRESSAPGRAVLRAAVQLAVISAVLGA